MDIRDIKEKVPSIKNGKGLEMMFDLQKKILNHYIKIEGLPAYPFDINIKSNQIIMKDFIGRIIEELGEAHESYLTMIDLQEINRNEKSEEGYKMLIAHLQNFNEEIADAIHFLLEAMIYCGIEANDINMYYDKLLKKLDIWYSYYEEDNLLKTCLNYGNYCNIMANVNKLNSNVFPIIKEIDLKDEFLRGGRFISDSILNEHKTQCWDITYNLNISRNFLKNKPWKQTQMLTDINRFQQQMMEAWLYFFKYMNFISMNSQSIFTIYFKKNLVNQFRINSKY